MKRQGSVYYDVMQTLIEMYCNFSSCVVMCACGFECVCMWMYV